VTISSRSQTISLNTQQAKERHRRSVRKGEPAYHVEKLDKCSPVWLRALFESKVIESLLANINARVEEELSATKSGVQVLAATANLPLRDLDTGLVEAAKKLDFGVVIEHWQSAQSALGVDPPDATTRASSLIETLSRHILGATGTPPPKNECIQHLYGAAARAFGISPEQQVTDDLRAIAGGMNAVVVGIGALRTHAGTAHGKEPDNQPITFQQGRLAVNAAGVLATFLMDILSAHTTANPKPPATS
jgi:Abortive infection C-terminus